MSITLKDWLDENHTLEEKQKLFYNMSKTMHYIHDNNHYIKNFNPKQIEIVNPEALTPIKYKTVTKMPNEYREQIINEDIYNLAFIQISTYANIDLNILKPTFLKENFNLFAQYLPEEDCNYLRGVIESGSIVYYYQYKNADNERRLNKLVSETGEEGLSATTGYQKAKTNGRYTADKETKALYRDIKL